MVSCRKQLVPVIATTSLLLASGALASGISQAQEAILIPGAMPLKAINPFYPIVAPTYPEIGKYFRSDPDPQIVDYSQDALAADQALLDGVTKVTDVVQGTNGTVVIIGESMGSMVAWRVAEGLAKSTNPRTEDISVVLIAPPEAGIAEYFKEGTFIPILNYTITRIRQSPYPTTIVIGEYDGWADPPDRPWNLISSANALLGTQFVHGPPIFTSDVSGLTPLDDGHPDDNVKTYLVPTENLPLTQVFREVGVPDALVDKADEVLRPIIDAGYVRHDQPGDTRPYLHDGEIHRNVQSQQLVRELSSEPGETGQNVGQERREHRSEVRQAVRKNLRDLGDRVEAGFRQLKEKIAERRAPRPSDQGGDTEADAG
jgi:pimeloyl-ACP methyl ester carboxylesterase